MKPLRFAVLALGLLAACGDDDDVVGFEEVPIGALSFDLVGAGFDRSFVSSGALDLDAAGVPVFGPFAFAVRDESGRSDAMLITAFSPGQQPRGQTTVLFLESARGTGDHSLDYECNPGFGNRCAFGLFAPDVHIENADLQFEPQGEVFVFDTGTLSVTRFTDDRVEGTFSGVGVFINVATMKESAPVEVVGGRFEVPILRQGRTGVLVSRSTPEAGLLRRLVRPPR